MNTQDLVIQLHDKGISDAKIAALVGTSGRYIGMIRTGEKKGLNLYTSMQEILGNHENIVGYTSIPTPLSNAVRKTNPKVATPPTPSVQKKNRTFSVPEVEELDIEEEYVEPLLSQLWFQVGIVLVGVVIIVECIPKTRTPFNRTMKNFFGRMGEANASRRSVNGEYTPTQVQEPPTESTGSPRETTPQVERVTTPPVPLKVPTPVINME